MYLADGYTNGNYIELNRLLLQIIKRHYIVRLNSNTNYVIFL